MEIRDTRKRSVAVLLREMDGGSPFFFEGVLFVRCKWLSGTQPQAVRLDDGDIREFHKDTTVVPANAYVYIVED
jgi:hypothetical protein